MRRRFILFLIIILTVRVVLAQGPVEATVSALLNVRSGPGVDYEVVTKINPHTAVIVDGRNEISDWLFIHTLDDSIRGWVAIGFVEFDHPIRVREALPLLDAEAAAPSPNKLTFDESGAPVIPEIPPEVTDYPQIWFDAGMQQNVRTIFQRGQQAGRHPFSFMKVGESNIAGTVFLCNFQWGNYYLGDHQELQLVVDQFNQTGSFCHFNVSAQSGFSTTTILDPTFAPPETCEPNETPLACEIRRSNASYAFLYLGISDMVNLSGNQFRNNLTVVVRQLSSSGVVPILATYPMSDDFVDATPHYFNDIVREVGQAERVPIIDVRSTVWNYDNHGTGPDGYHLSVPQGEETAFGGNELHYGRTLYEFLAMQLLYRMITEINI